MGLASAITGIVNGFQQAGAVSDASKARQAGINQSTADYANSVNTVNPQIQAAGDKASSGFTDASNTAAAGVTGAANAGIGRVDAATKSANDRLDPYATAGAGASTTLGQMLGPDGALMHKFGTRDMQDDDGYKFRLQQGQEALERNASARGATGGGGVMKALVGYGQDMASQEYDKAFQRFSSGNRDRFDMLNTTANRGYQASGQQGQNDVGAGVYGANAGTVAARYAGDAGITAGRYAGDVGIRSTDMQAGNALDLGRFRAGNDVAIGDTKAAEHIGRGNAWSGTLSGIGNAADGILTGGFGGGGGFSPMGAITGIPRAQGGYAPGGNGQPGGQYPLPSSSMWDMTLKGPGNYGYPTTGKG